MPGPTSSTSPCAAGRACTPSRSAEPGRPWSGAGSVYRADWHRPARRPAGAPPPVTTSSRSACPWNLDCTSRISPGMAARRSSRRRLLDVARAAEDGGHRAADGDGPPLADRGHRPAGGRDARGVHDARLSRRRHRARAAPRARDRGRLPRARAAREVRHDARRALGRSRGPRHRRRLERGGGERPRPALPLDPRAVRAPRGDRADLRADVERQRRAVRGRALPARAHAQLAAEPEAGPPTS